MLDFKGLFSLDISSKSLNERVDTSRIKKNLFKYS